MTGETDEGPRKEFFYINDDGQLVALRYNRWKAVFLEQRANGFEVWIDPFVPLRVPKIFNLRTDPYERASLDANNYQTWLIQRLYLLAPAQAYVGDFLSTFAEYPASQTPAKFNLDDVMKQLKETQAN